jgi:hypothetical protein
MVFDPVEWHFRLVSSISVRNFANPGGSIALLCGSMAFPRGQGALPPGIFGISIE